MTKIILASGSLGRRKLLEALKIPFEVIEAEIDEDKIVDADPVKMALARATAKAQRVYDSIVGAAREPPQVAPSAPPGNGHDRSLQRNINIRVNPVSIIIGADTVGFVGSWIFNKPKSRREAEEILRRLSGKTHTYVSAHTIVKFEARNPKSETRLAEALAKRANSNDKKNNAQNKYQNRNCYFRNLNFKNCFEFRVSNFEFITDYDLASVTLRKLTAADIKFYLDRVPFTKLCGAIQIMNSPQNFVVATRGSLSTIIGLCLEKLIPMMQNIK